MHTNSAISSKSTMLDTAARLRLKRRQGILPQAAAFDGGGFGLRLRHGGLMGNRFHKAFAWRWMGLRLGQTLQLAALCAGNDFRPSETLPLQQSVLFLRKRAANARFASNFRPSEKNENKSFRRPQSIAYFRVYQRIKNIHHRIKRNRERAHQNGEARAPCRNRG